MQYRKFGNTDLLVSEIGFGAWAIGGGAMIGTVSIGWGDSDDTVSEKAIYASLDAGINFFDTADIYGLGHSEELLGKTIGSNKELIIATKVGNVSRNEQFTTDYSKNYIPGACEQSLRRLKRDVIDYYQLHTARLSHLQQGDCITAMQLLQEQGKIRYWGLSLNTFDPLPEAQFLMENNLGNGFQLVLNLLNQKALGLFSKAAEKGYGIIARMPLQFGLLTGKFDLAAEASAKAALPSEASAKSGTKSFFADNDHRKNRLVTSVIEAANHALQPVWDLCASYNCTKTELAMSYILSYPELSTIIPGIRTVEQAKLNTTGLFKLKSEDKLLIEELGKGKLVEVMQLIQQQG